MHSSPSLHNLNPWFLTINTQLQPPSSLPITTKENQVFTRASPTTHPPPSHPLASELVPFKQTCVGILKAMVQLYPTLLLDEPCLESNYSPTLLSPLAGYLPHLALPTLHTQLKTCMVHANALCTQIMVAPISEQALQKLHQSAETTVARFKCLYQKEQGNDKESSDLALAFVRAFGEFATCVLELTDSFIQTGMLLTSQERTIATPPGGGLSPPTMLPSIPAFSPLQASSPSSPLSSSHSQARAKSAVPKPSFPPNIRNPYVNIPAATGRYAHQFGLTRVDLLNEYTSKCGLCQQGFRMLEKKVVCKDCKLTLHEHCHEHGQPESMPCTMYNSPEPSDRSFKKDWGLHF